MTSSEDLEDSVDSFERAAASEPTAVSEPIPPPVSERRTALIIFAATFTGVAIVVAAALFAFGRGGAVANGSAAVPSSTAGAAASSGHVASNSALASPRTPEYLASSVKMSAKLRAVLRSWNDGRGGKALTAVSTQLGTALQAGGVKQYVTMRAACTSLSVAVSAARTGPPIPNRVVQERYTKALTEVAGAAADCHAAISERVDGDETVATYENPALFHRAEIGFSVAVKDLYGVTAELASASR